MAIKLPRASREPRPRKMGGVSATSANVPTVVSPSDPGLNIPLDDAPAKALQLVAGNLNEQVDLGIQMVQRDEGLRREADDRAYSKLLSESMTELEAAGDMSDPEVVQALGERMKQEKDAILSKHKGGSISKQLLQDRLERRHIDFSDKLAARNVNAANDRAKMAVDQGLSALTQDVLKDPDVLLSEDPLTAYRKAMKQWEDNIEFWELNPRQSQVSRQLARANIVNTMITSLLNNDQTDRAREILRDEEISGVLDPAIQRDAAQRIVNFEKEKENPEREWRALWAKAENLAGPGASDDKVRAIARQLEGIKEASPNTEIWTPAGGGPGFLINTETGELIATVGPTLEEEAERARRLKVAEGLGNIEVTNKLLETFGVQTLPMPTATGVSAGTALPGGEKEGTTQATVKTKDGEVGPEFLSNPDLMINPFGPDTEVEDVSQQIQRVNTLLAASRVLNLAGKRSEAASFFNEAQYIMQNSDEIKRKNELDKMIDPRLAADHGLPPGATFRDLIKAQGGQPTMTSEELARREARGKAAGRAEVLGQEQIMFLREARDEVVELMEDIKLDPTIVGALGGLRATGRNITTALGDLGFSALVEEARDLADFESELGMDEVLDLFENETLSVLDILTNSIGLKLARVQTPEGRIPVEVIKRSINDAKLTGAMGTDVVQDRLNKLLQKMDRRERYIKRRFPDLEGFLKEKDDAGPDIPEGTPVYKKNPKTGKYELQE